MLELSAINELQIINITNCCGRKLSSSEPFDGKEDKSMNDMVVPKCHFDQPNLIGPYKNDIGEIVFKPIKSMKLFKKDECGNDICLSDVNQGMIGDCWFLSAIDFSINHPMWHDSLKESVSEMSNGQIKIRLYDTESGTWKETYLDTRLLVNGDYIPTTISVLSKDSEEIWPAMLEKGLAKMCGGYPNIEGGWMSEGMCFLHGGRGYFISSHEIVPKSLENDEFLNRLVKDLKNLFDLGYGIFTAWEKEIFTSVFEKGLVDSHAYSILDMQKIDGEWVFKVMNPWGKFEWNGKYSDSDTSDSAEKARTLMSEKRKDNGIFLMSAFDLLGRCEGLDIFEPLKQNIISSIVKTNPVNDDPKVQHDNIS